MGKPLAGGGVHDRKLLSSCWGPAGPWIPSITPAESGGCFGVGPRSGGPGEERALGFPSQAKRCIVKLCLAPSAVPDTVPHVLHIFLHPFLKRNPMRMMTVIIPISQRRKPRSRALKYLRERQGLGGMDVRPPATRGALHSSQKPGRELSHRTKQEPHLKKVQKRGDLHLTNVFSVTHCIQNVIVLTCH